MKKIIYGLFALLLFFSLNVNASTKTYERTEENGYGVKKETDYHDRLDHIKKTKYVDAKEKIYDFSDILTEDEEKELKGLIDEYYKKTGFEIVILTDNVAYIKDSENTVYAEDFYDYNDFGLEDKYYSGVIIFRNTYENPYYEMVATGKAQIYYPLKENALINNDDMLDIDYILDSIYDEISGKQYLSGFKHFISILNTMYDSGIPREMEGYTLDDTGHLVPPEKPPEEYKTPTILMLISSIVGTSIFTGVNVKKNKMVKHEYDADNYLDHSTINYTKRTDTFVNSVVTHHRISTDSGGSGGGGFSSHTGSSGFGHTSGGRHG
ncbi:MAG: TPM domain-containing protein [Bacilli bacterium]|nr:TPM domain-containing protein [Bacilli bacterium]